MNNDLISREALKKSFEDTVCIEPMPYTFVKQIIDNAPTVKSVVLTEEAYSDLCLRASKERPQGEWIKIGELGLAYKCNKCEEVSVIPENFCPNCGASMKPKANQLRDCENCIHHSDNGCEVWECKFKRRSS